MNGYGIWIWLASAATFGCLWLLARHFARRVYRTAAVVAISTGAVLLFWHGDSTGESQDVFSSGANDVARHMFLPDGAELGPGGWVAVAAVLIGLVAALDTVSARREPPRVHIPEAPTGAYPAEQSAAGLAGRRYLTEELRFLLPAVQVRQPGGMPGASTLETIASIGDATGLRTAKQAAALARVVHALEAKPRSFVVRLFVETLDDHRLRVTVDLRDERNGASIFSTVSAPQQRNEAAKWAAAVVARQVLECDPTTPRWVLGSPDGADLGAYLMARTEKPADRTYPAVFESRQTRRRMLEWALRGSRDGGLMRYELAGMYDIDGDHVTPVLLHLINRVRYPRFLAARYRFAMSMAMLAGPDFVVHWRNSRPETRHGIGSLLDRAGLLRPHPAGSDPGPRLDRSKLLDAFEGESADDFRLVQRHLLKMAIHEFEFCRKANSLPWLVWNALIHRDERSTHLAKVKRGGWKLNRYSLEPRIGQDIVELRLRALDGSLSSEDLATAQDKWLRNLGLGEEGTPWVDGRLPWQAVYNLACLCALPLEDSGPPDDDVRRTVRLLRHAVTDHTCELDQPSEWLVRDPDLLHLHGRKLFDELIAELAVRDFDAVDLTEVRHTSIRITGVPWISG